MGQDSEPSREATTGCEPGQAESIVIASLEEVDPLGSHAVHQSMLLGEPARPDVRAHCPQRLRFPDTVERIAQDRVDQVEQPECRFAIRFDPPPQIVQEDTRDTRLAFRALTQR